MSAKFLGVSLRFTLLLLILPLALSACKNEAQSAITKKDFFSSVPKGVNQKEFVSVKGTHFRCKNKPYYFLGTNFWYGAYLGVDGEVGDRKRLIRELDLLKQQGILNLRILAASESSDMLMSLRPAIQGSVGQYNEKIFVGLDFLLVEMAKRDMKAVLFLNNFWQWSGGMSQYVSWVTGEQVIDPDVSGDWSGFISNSARFYQLPEAQALYQQQIKKVVTRVNTLSGRVYSEDPTIMAWELANEPRPGNDGDSEAHVKYFVEWVHKSAKYIHSLDANHLVTTGNEGFEGSIKSEEVYLRAHASPYIDYLTFHLWPKNWSWLDIKQAEKTYPRTEKLVIDYIDQHVVLAKKLNKPTVLEEFGVERDNADYRVTSTTFWRDKLFKVIFDRIYLHAQNGGPIAGSNFWAWGGFGRSMNKDFVWREGDSFLGDPPQEPQGINSVFFTDVSTIAGIKLHADEMGSLSE